MTGYAELIEGALGELGPVLEGVDQNELGRLADAIAGARHIVVYGVGREGLMMRALAMRLYHLGLMASVAGDMSAPPVTTGDLLLVSAGPGDFATVAGLVGVAREAGARTACVTAQPHARVPSACDVVVTIPAQTMANDQGAGARSVLPMGSLFEVAQFLTFEILVLLLRKRLGVEPEAMRARHTNLE